MRDSQRRWIVKPTARASCLTGALWVAVLLSVAAHAQATVYPPLSTEIGPAHPLFLFSIDLDLEAPPEGIGATVQQVWDRIPPALQPYSALRFDAGEGAVGIRVSRYRDAMEVLQPLGIPLVLSVRPDDPRERMSVRELEELLSAYTNIRGIDLTGMTFDTYPLPETPPQVAAQAGLWLADLAHTAAQYGRFTHLAMAELHWARAMSNVTAAPFYHKLRECKGYIIPAAWQRGTETIPAQAATMGLWLEEAAAFWGVAADGRWYVDAPFLGPGRLGRDTESPGMPGAFYRAMVLNGAMAGATTFAFGPAQSLWGAPASSPLEQHIFPLLQRILNLALIPDATMVRERAPVAYQLAPAATPEDFHLNLRDWSPRSDAGNLIRAAYTPQQAGAMPELVPNRSGPFWIPLLSAHATEEARNAFALVADPGTHQNVQQWTDALNAHFPMTERGGPFVNEVGRGVFVMNTLENAVQAQPFEIAAAPAPVRAIAARRTDDGVVLTWPFREGDVSFSVYRKVPPAANYERVAQGLLDRTYTDSSAPALALVSYSVTALTNETETFAGQVEFGDFLAFSRVESRMAEEVTLSPVLADATSAPLPPPAPAIDGQAFSALPPVKTPPEDTAPIREEILQALAALREGYETANLDLLMRYYSEGYEDPEGWGRQYAQRAYQWMFERYRAHRMLYQVRDWDFESYESAGTVNVQLFVEMGAVAISDTSGAKANPRIHIPRTDDGLVWTTWTRQEGAWSIIFSNPAWPNFRELLSYLTGPFDNYPLGPDRYVARP